MFVPLRFWNLTAREGYCFHQSLFGPLPSTSCCLGPASIKRVRSMFIKACGIVQSPNTTFPGHFPYIRSGASLLVFRSKLCNIQQLGPAGLPNQAKGSCTGMQCTNQASLVAIAKHARTHLWHVRHAGLGSNDVRRDGVQGARPSSKQRKAVATGASPRWRAPGDR